ncbi:MAG: DUF4160 domain-containing protein [Clostridia bacterium]|nr:DUF4160 domain-containing protein [Clostridia bacterium]
MPTISMFYGIIISMYWEKEGQHHSPHFHARYGEEKAEVDFDGQIIAGALPPKQASIVKAWALIHQDELRANWELAMQDEPLYKIEPLK